MPWMLRTAGSVELRMHGPDRPTRPVAVVLHGVGSTADFALRCLAGPLTDLGYDVVAPDLRGHAGSTALPDPADHSLDHHVADLAVLADRLDIRLVAGISLGSEIALRWLAGRSDLDGAALCLPGIAGPSSGPAAANRAAADQLAALGVPAVLDAMGDAPHALRWVVEEVRASWPQHEPASLVAALRAVAGYDVIDDATARGVSTPVGLVGVTDDAGHPPGTTSALAAVLPRSATAWLQLADLASDRAALGRAAVGAMQDAQAVRRPDPQTLGH